jgi:hypothetical protein
MAHRSETSLMLRVQHTRRDRSFGANSKNNNIMLIKAPCLLALAVRAPRGLPAPYARMPDCSCSTNVCHCDISEIFAL